MGSVGISSTLKYRSDISQNEIEKSIYSTTVKSDIGDLIPGSLIVTKQLGLISIKIDL
jgi:hypothetical protein